ncbi:MAG TPA: NAD(P)-binding domain-containing protein [Candidatus Saccharimonadales bacterium]|nr:NAD(P)-binding domain-containing protein [Candidatus Saccharimonadales bacterium]
MQNHQFSQVGIVGAGELGQALGGALSRANVQVIYYDILPAKTTTTNIEDLVRACEVIILCVPSWSISDVCKTISKAAIPNEKRLVISCSKGALPGFETVDKVLVDRLPDHYASGLLFGPMSASEIAQGKIGEGIVSLTDMSYYSALREMFALANIYVEASADLRGVAVGGALKNIYAMAVGMSDGLRLGSNAKSRLIVLIIAEMRRLIAELGGNPATAEGSAGLGDLVCATVTSESFNYRVGKSLAEGIVDPHVKSEGVVALHELSRKIKLADYPIVNTLNQIAFHYAKPQKFMEILH